eukprot:74996_1
MLSFLFGSEKKEEVVYPLNPSIIGYSSDKITDNLLGECSRMITWDHPTINNGVKTILDKQAFNEEYKFEKLLDKTNESEIWTVIHKYSGNIFVCKVYDVNINNNSNISELSYDANTIKHYYKEYKMMKVTKLLLYNNIYYDKLNKKCMIVMERLQFDLYKLYKIMPQNNKYKPKNE